MAFALSEYARVLVAGATPMSRAQEDSRGSTTRDAGLRSQVQSASEDCISERSSAVKSLETCWPAEA